MSLHKLLSTSIVCLFFLLATAAPFAGVAFAQDMGKTVLPITQWKWIGPGVEAKFGTGFCVDKDCRYIGTTYHVAMMARPRKVKGEKIIQRYLATGPDDDGATVNEGFSVSPLKYTLTRDLAIFELHQPLRHYHGIAFSLNDLQIGQEVDIYAYPQQSIHPIRGLLRFHGMFKGESTGGLLAFDYDTANETAMHPGASGGLVVDSKTQQIVGVLNGLARNEEGIVLAVPTQSLADFVSKVQPWLAQSLFPSATNGTISPFAGDVYPKFVPPHAAHSLEQRRDEPAEVKALREKAQLLANNMSNMIAVQRLAWGSRNSAPAAVAEYEVKVLDGFQRFRVYPDGKKELQNVPFPPVNTVVVPGGEWSELPQMVGTALHLRIHQGADTVVDGRQVKVFQYRAEAEDAVPCNFFKSVLDLGFFPRSKLFTVPCYGEVWTDEDFHILRISQHLELSGKWKDYVSVVTYGWLRRTGEAPRLIPVTISTQAEFNHKVYWCRGVFTNYRIFSSQSKITTSDYVQSLPP